MPQILVIYTTMRGRTGDMVEPICAGIQDEGVAVLTRSVDMVTWEEMLAADGIIVGNPTRFGGMDWQLKRLFDVTAFQDYPGPLVGKVGGAFGAGGRSSRQPANCPIGRATTSIRPTISIAHGSAAHCLRRSANCRSATAQSSACATAPSSTRAKSRPSSASRRLRCARFSSARAHGWASALTHS